MNLFRRGFTCLFQGEWTDNIWMFLDGEGDMKIGTTFSQWWGRGIFLSSLPIFQHRLGWFCLCHMTRHSKPSATVIFTSRHSAVRSEYTGGNRLWSDSRIDIPLTCFHPIGSYRLIINKVFWSVMINKNTRFEFTFAAFSTIQPSLCLWCSLDES